METNYLQSAVLENSFLLRLIGGYIFDGTRLPFILSFKAARDAFKPSNTRSGKKWIRSDKKSFVTSVSKVEWAQSLGCEFNSYKLLIRWNNNLFTYAASNGSVDMLKWLHQKYPPIQYPAGIRYFVCCEAAGNGRIEILEYLRSLGTIVQWNENVSAYAANRGHLHILHWLREVLDPPCPWNEYTCFYAAEGGHLHVLEWLRSQEPPCPWVKQECIDKAINNSLYEVVEWILSQPESI